MEVGMAKILLVHGILGFGSVFPDQPVNYFNGIQALFEAQGHEVFCPSLPALGSVATRAQVLERAILQRWPTQEPIFALAHSLGGLDCRHVIAASASLAGRIRRLITVATPHFGSPFADAASRLGSIVIPPFPWLNDLLAKDQGALADLTTRGSLRDPDVPGVEYLCIGGETTVPNSALFAATALFGGLWGARSDGLVSLASASKTHEALDLWQRWPVDHGAAIGWPTKTGKTLAAALKKPPAAHLERYRTLLPRLVA